MNLPNWITIIRILLIPVFVVTLLKYREVHLEYFRLFSIWIFILAALTDAVDGAIARLRRQKTALGTLLDPLADKMLLLSGILLLGLNIQGLAQLPVWIPVIIISRDLILIFGALVIYISDEKLTIVPNMLGKITTTCQMLTIIWILLKIPMPQVIWRAAGIFTFISGIIYIYEGSKQFAPFEKR